MRDLHLMVDLTVLLVLTWLALGLLWVSRRWRRSLLLVDNTFTCAFPTAICRWLRLILLGVDDVPADVLDGVIDDLWVAIGWQDQVGSDLLLLFLLLHLDRFLTPGQITTLLLLSLSWGRLIIIIIIRNSIVHLIYLLLCLF